jgi:hypothetical protein
MKQQEEHESKLTSISYTVYHVRLTNSCQTTDRFEYIVVDCQWYYDKNTMIDSIFINSIESTLL